MPPFWIALRAPGIGQAPMPEALSVRSHVTSLPAAEMRYKIGSWSDNPAETWLAIHLSSPLHFALKHNLSTCSLSLLNRPSFTSSIIMLPATASWIVLRLGGDYLYLLPWPRRRMHIRRPNYNDVHCRRPTRQKWVSPKTPRLAIGQLAIAQLHDRR